MTFAEEASEPTSRTGTRALVLLGCAGVALVGLCVCGPGLAGALFNWNSDRIIVRDTTPTVRAFFEATSRGDLVAAAEWMDAHAAETLEERVAAAPADFDVHEVRDVRVVEAYFHHPFVIGAKLELADGRLRYGRFRVYHDHARSRWVIDAFAIGDAMPDVPTVDGYE